MSRSETAVIIVSGLPRSGTSMMMRMLEAGGIPVLTDGIRGPDEDNPQGYYEFEPVKRTKQDPSWVASAGGKAVKMVYRLLYDLPADIQYRVIFMRRNMDEVLASQRKMLQRQGQLDDTVTDEQMARLFQSQLQKFDEWVPRQANLDLLEVNYNELVENPASPLGEVNAFLGGRLDTAAMAEVVDGSLYRNRF